MAEDKRIKVKKGWLAVRVGIDEEGGLERLEIPISYLHHPLFKNLLDTAREVYGYRAPGLLRLPCSVDDFLYLRWLVKHDSHNFHIHHHCHCSR